jgi:hypothetical protein
MVTRVYILWRWHPDPYFHWLCPCCASQIGPDADMMDDRHEVLLCLGFRLLRCPAQNEWWYRNAAHTHMLITS